MIARRFFLPWEVGHFVRSARAMTSEAQEAIVEVFRVLERLTGRAPSNAAVFAIVRDHVGFKFRNGEAKTLLAKFREKSGSAQGPERVRAGSESGPVSERAGTSPGPGGVQPGSTLGGPSRARDKVFLVPNPEKTSSSAPAQARRGRGSPQLPLDLPEVAAAKAIMLAVWTELQPSIGRAMTKTDWGKRNMSAARSLARLGHSPEAVLAAWRSASRAFGEPVRMLGKVQDHMAERDASRAGRPTGGVQNTVLR